MGFRRRIVEHSTGTGNAIEPAIRFEVTVLFTDIRSTLSALRTAAQLSQGLGSRIRLLLLETVPYPLPLDAPRRNVQFLGRRFRTVVDGYPAETESRSIETVAEIVLCRDACDGLCQVLQPGSVLVIGKQNRWLPSREDRWSEELRRAGHHVVRTSAPAAPSMKEFVKGIAHA